MASVVESLVQLFKRYITRYDECKRHLPPSYLLRLRLAREHYSNPLIRLRRGQSIKFMHDRHLSCIADGLHNRVLRAANRWTPSAMTLP
jgi:hypothetical protein